MTAIGVLRDVLAEDQLLWQFWLNKGMEAAPLAQRLARLTSDGQAPNWDYLAGNALYGGFEEQLLALLKGPGASSRVPSDFLDRLASDVTGSPSPIGPFTPEGKLLVLCASPRMTAAEDLEAARLSGGPVDWESLVQAAARANLTAAVQHNLTRLQLDLRMPPALAGVLASRARGIAARNRRMMALVDELAGMLRAEGIRVLLLKESALAISHYGNGRLRMMGDIDLLLGPGDIDRVSRMLVSRGYELAEMLWTRQHYLESHHHAAPPAHPDLAVKIEPHHAIGLPPFLETDASALAEQMAARAVRIDAHTWCFTPADTLFHVGLDMLGGAFLGKMGQVCDAREVIRQGGVEWALLEEMGERAGAEAHLAFSLSLLADLGAPVPRDVIRRLGRARKPSFAPRALRRMAERNLFGYVRCRSTLTRGGIKLRYMALMQPGGWAGRAAFLLRRYLYMDAPPEETMGPLARRVRPTTPQAVGRMMTLPLRALRRWTASRRMP